MEVWLTVNRTVGAAELLTRTLTASEVFESEPEVAGAVMERLPGTPSAGGTTNVADVPPGAGRPLIFHWMVGVEAPPPTVTLKGRLSPGQTSRAPLIAE